MKPITYTRGQALPASWKAHRHPRRRHGHHDPALQAHRGQYRGERFKDFHKDVKGNNDLLCSRAPT
jgi:5-methyltetrahydrofolate--homocysteine methyltransferase